MKKLIIFDLDDTLIDTSDVVFKAFNDVLENKKLKPISKETYEHIKFWSGDSEKALKEVGVANQTREEFLKEYDPFFSKATEQYIKAGKMCLFNAVFDTLTRLKENALSLAIVTNSPHETTISKMCVFNLLPFFDIILTPQHLKNVKPHPEGIFKAMEKAKANAAETLVVGDSRHDLWAARNAAVECVLITSDAEKGKLADYWAKDFNEFSNIIRLFV